MSNTRAIKLRKVIEAAAKAGQVAASSGIRRITMLRGWLTTLANSVLDAGNSDLNAEHAKAAAEITRAGDDLEKPIYTADSQAAEAITAAKATRDSKKLEAARVAAFAANTSAADLNGQVAGVIKTLSKRASSLGRSAFGLSDTSAGKSIFKVADAAAAEAAAGKDPPPKLDFGGHAKAHGKDKTDTGMTVADQLNNLGPGLGGGIAAAIETSLPKTAAGQTAYITTQGASTGAGAAFGALGIVFGLISLGLGLRAIKRGAHKAKRLKALIPNLSNRHLKSIAAYAAEQKRKKKWGGAIGATLGGAAVVAGVVGLVALSVTTLGIGAIILGMGVAALGIGLLIGKAFHKWNKRRKGRAALKEVADTLITMAASGDATAIRSLRDDYGKTVGQITADELYEKMRESAMSKRAEMAEKTVTHLVQGSPSERFDAERIVLTLGLKPAKLRGQSPATAKDRVMRKLSSW